MTKRLLDGINRIEGVRLIGPPSGANRGSAISVRVGKTPPAETALTLDSAFGIAVRSGLHCSSDAHRSLGTLDNGGAVRISPNYFNSEEDIDRCLEALDICAKGL